MSFEHYEASVKLPDEVWAAFPQVQIFLSQAGEELRIAVVSAADRFLLPGMVQNEPEVFFLHSPGWIKKFEKQSLSSQL